MAMRTMEENKRGNSKCWRVAGEGFCNFKQGGKELLLKKKRLDSSSKSWKSLTPKAFFDV